MHFFSFSQSNSSPLAAAGAIWDLVGAFYLAKALIFNPDQSMRRQAGAYWDISIPLLRSLCEQRIDARFGIAMLMIGFLLQLLGSMGIKADWPVDILLLLPLIMVVYSRNRNFDQWVIASCLRIAGRSGVERGLWRESYFPDISQREFDAAFDHHEKNTSPYRP